MKRKRILIVEDEAILALSLKRVLEKNNYNVVGILASGEEVLREVENLKPDAILMDIGLNGSVDGIYVAQKLEQKYPLIYVTSYRDKDIMERMQSTKPRGILPKPFSEFLVIKSLEQVLMDNDNANE